ncbi:uncharacterized protein LOC124622812 [Schistocerca americana]|uniref:uncharacterized protein LOC124622812 n=1 Tax=Schistocerca americana TaxID=7009 RepID=UPI001F4F8647|nr:uncharacterized protein LOC124622812 [Schistocerca americana]
MKIDYDLPSNATQLFGQAAERALGRLTRWQLYATAEAALSSMGVDGRACVLRAICEAAETPLRQDSLLAELSHLLLTPSTTDSGSSEGRRYLAAEHAGAAAGMVDIVQEEHIRRDEEQLSTYLSARAEEDTFEPITKEEVA